jgi:hypothetical protein
MIHLIELLQSAGRYVLLCVFIFCAGFISGIVLNNHLSHGNSPKNLIETKRISGESIKVNNLRTEGSSFSFTTIAGGKGEAVTTISKEAIPEARDFINRTNTISVSAGYFYSGSYCEPFVGTGYLKRFGNFSAGGGVMFSRHIAGAYASAQLGL